MTKILGYAFAAVFGGIFVLLASTSYSSENWHLAYAHDEQGVTVSGSKDDLIKAVRNGKPVRVSWAGRRVEHVADAYFLTVFEGEVFTQVEAIRAQKPIADPPSIIFHDPEVQWSTILATNGEQALKWFVQY